MTLKDIFDHLAYNVRVTIAFYDDLDGEEIILAEHVDQPSDVSDLLPAEVDTLSPGSFDLYILLDAEIEHAETPFADYRLFCVNTGANYRLFHLAYAKDAQLVRMFDLSQVEYTPQEALRRAADNLHDYIIPPEE